VGLLVADLKSLSPRYEHVRKSGLSKSRARNPAETGRAGEEETEGGEGQLTAFWPKVTVMRFPPDACNCDKIWSLRVMKRS